MVEKRTPRKLWEHSNPSDTHISRFRDSLEKAYSVQLKNWRAFHDFSCQRQSDFWRHAFTTFPIVFNGTVPAVVVDESRPIDSLPSWFPGVELNFAQNILFVGDKDGSPKTSPGKEDDKMAVTEVREGSFLEPIRQITWKQLRQRVGRLASAMRANGVRKGDRIALVASTSIDTLVVFLATTSIGAIFSSSSTDMGNEGIWQRLKQIRPKFVFMDDWAVYNGKTTDLRPKMRVLAKLLGGLSEFSGIVSQCRFRNRPADVSNVPRAETWNAFLSAATTSELVFESLGFTDPFLIVYSSGTTGTPKCIVHCVGGVVLNGWKECHLHRDIDYTSTQLQYTTTGWIMYMGSVLALLTGAHMICYDGSPLVPDKRNMIRLVSQLKATHLGISPRYLQTLQSSSILPREVADLSALKVVTSTGMVLPEALFEWFYDFGFPRKVQLDNICGGTDIAGAFGAGNPMLPLYVGGCQCISLGFSVKAVERTGSGRDDASVAECARGQPGELVCTKSFPSMPVMFWPGDQSAMQKYHDSYFTEHPHKWTQGDFIMFHPVTDQVMFLGRADGVLNPSGIRFGSAEIYAVIDKNFPQEIADSICVGQRRPQDSDENVMLFVLLKEGQTWTRTLEKKMRQAIRTELSPRHVPKFIFETPEIPTTINLKKVEMPVKEIVSGKRVKPSSTLLNPQCLNFYYQFAEVEKLEKDIQSML